MKKSVGHTSPNQPSRGERPAGRKPDARPTRGRSKTTVVVATVLVAAAIVFGFSQFGPESVRTSIASTWSSLFSSPTPSPTMSPTPAPTSTPTPSSSPTPTAAPTATPTLPPTPPPTVTPAPGTTSKLPAVNTVPLLYHPDLSKYTTEAWKNSAQPLLGITVFVDAGHGGSTTKIRDSGAVYAGVQEAPINFKVALLLRTELEARGATVVMTRTEDDQFKSLHYRVALLAHYVFLDHRNASGADIALLDRLEALFTPSITLNTDDYSTNGRSVYKGLGARPDLRTILDMQNQHKDIVFVALHCNSLPTATSVHGLEVYWASRNMIYNDERHLAADKTVKDKYPINPSYQFYDDSARLKFALALKYGIIGTCPELENPKLVNHQVVEGNYAVLREENVVSALVEMGYLTNATDRANLLKPEYQQRIASGVADGITSFYCG